MTQSKRTPGPWRYEQGTKTIRSVPANYWLASMNSWDGAVDHEANAHLIAAAPDLLEALRELLDDVEGQRVTLRVREQVRAAISKAEGQP